MWSYYGSKSKVVDLYPPPKFDKIIEPFAGSARYALKWFDRDVILVDKYSVIIDLWNYLKQASEKDILKLPKLKQGDDIRDYKLTEEETLLLGFCAGLGGSTIQYKVSKFADFDNGNSKTYKRIADNLFKIRHWEIKQGDFIDIENQEASWYIDPPYQFGGEHYKCSNKQIDFSLLADWCIERKGQTIVCENTKADWMEFKPMVKAKGTRTTNTTEAIWSNIPTNYDNIQQTLF